MKILFTLIITSLSLVFFAGSSEAQTITSAGSGNWSSPSTWVNGIVPDSTHNVIIDAAHTVTIDDGNASCSSISFLATTSHLSMGSTSSVLSVYGNFTLFSTTHQVFLNGSWPAGAKTKLAGGAAVQTLSGWSSTASSTIFMELIIDKWNGKVVTDGTNMRFSWGTSFEINNGTFELALTDDLESRDLTGTAFPGTFTIQANGIFIMDGSSSHIRRGTNLTDTVASRTGKMTVYGNATLASTSTNRVNIGGIDIMSGGTVTINTGWSSSNLNLFNCSLITVYDGGTLSNLTTTNIWHATAWVEVLSGGEFNSSASTTPLPFTIINNGSYRFSRSDVQTLPAAITTYNNLILSGGGIKTLGATITVNGTLSLRGTATLALGSFALNYGPSSILQYGSSGQISPATTTDAEWPAIGGPLNVTIYNTGGVTLHADRTIPGTLTLSSGVFDNNGLADDKTLTMANNATIRRASGSLTSAPSFAGIVNLEYYSTVTSATTSFEIPSSPTVLNNLIISSTQGVTLGSNATVNGTLTMSGSNLKLGSFNLTTNSISGGSASGYIVTDGSGSLTVNNVGATNVTFPVGFTDTYTPVVINNTGTPDNFSVSVNNTFDVAPNNNQVVNKKWTITEAVPGGSIAAVTLQWNSADENIAFIRSNPVYIGKYNGSAWEQTNAVYSDLGSGTYSASASGFTSFSSFGIGNNGALPVELSSFSSSLNGRIINLIWETKTEVNSSKFEIERASVDSKSTSLIWTSVGSVLASGTSTANNKYSFTEKNLQAGNYKYRLKIIDNDGSFKLSDVIDAEVNTPKNFELNQNYPNPFNPETVIEFNIPKASEVNISVFNSVGQKITTLFNEYMEAGYYQKSFSSRTNGQNLSSGIYFYVLNAGDVKIVRKMILMK